MNLRKGKIKTILDSSINSALLAVEIYNKPRSSFRVESYISLMIMSWTKLFLAYFHRTKGDIYYYKDAKNRFIKAYGERKVWDLTKCITTYGHLSSSIVKNLEFFIVLRNRIEHKYMDNEEISSIIFGECQAMLYNYEETLVKFFGEEYSINENLAYSLQFSKIRTKEQIKSSKELLTREVIEIKDFIIKYRNSIADEIFSSQEYSIKLIQIPKISNTNRNDLSIEFVNWNTLSEEDKQNYQKLSVLIKDKLIVKTVINPDKLKPSVVLKRVNEKITDPINQNDLKCINFIFSVRPYKHDNINSTKQETNHKYCFYDDAHNDYLYQQTWVEFIISLINNKKLLKQEWSAYFKSKTKLDINLYEKDLKVANNDLKLLF